MGDVIDFGGGTKGEVPVSNVLDGAKDLDMVIVLGFKKDGTEYFASSSGNAAECAWLAGRYVKLLMENADEYY